MNFHRLRRGFFLSSGILLGLECANQAYPVYTKWSSQNPDLSVPHNLECHVQKIASAMGLPRPHKIKVFISSGFSSVCAGHTLLPGGAVIGLPQCVLYRNLHDIKKAGITLCGDDIDWEGPVGEALAELLLPSGDHINFSIAHEVSHIQHLDMLPQCLVAPAAMLASYYTGYWLQFMYPRVHVRFVQVAMVLCMLLCISLQESLTHWQEYRADDRAATCRPSYANGGIEMMRKRITLDSELANISAKKIMWWRKILHNWLPESHPPFSERLQRLQQVRSLSRHYWGHE